MLRNDLVFEMKNFPFVEFEKTRIHVSGLWIFDNDTNDMKIRGSKKYRHTRGFSFPSFRLHENKRYILAIFMENL